MGLDSRRREGMHDKCEGGGAPLQKWQRPPAEPPRDEPWGDETETEGRELSNTSGPSTQRRGGGRVERRGSRTHPPPSLSLSLFSFFFLSLSLSPSSLTRRFSTPLRGRPPAPPRTGPGPPPRPAPAAPRPPAPRAAPEAPPRQRRGRSAVRPPGGPEQVYGSVHSVNAVGGWGGRVEYQNHPVPAAAAAAAPAAADAASCARISKNKREVAARMGVPNLPPPPDFPLAPPGQPRCGGSRAQWPRPAPAEPPRPPLQRPGPPPRRRPTPLRIAAGQCLADLEGQVFHEEAQQRPHR